MSEPLVLTTRDGGPRNHGYAPRGPFGARTRPARVPEDLRVSPEAVATSDAVHSH